MDGKLERYNEILHRQHLAEIVQFVYKGRDFEKILRFQLHADFYVSQS